MDFVHVEDVARANLCAAVAPATDHVYNVASGVEISLRECAEMLLRTMHSPLSPKHGPTRKVNPVPRRIADTSSAARDLGFVAAVPFDEGLAKAGRLVARAAKRGGLCMTR